MQLQGAGATTRRVTQVVIHNGRDGSGSCVKRAPPVPAFSQPWGERGSGYQAPRVISNAGMDFKLHRGSTMSPSPSFEHTAN